MRIVAGLGNPGREYRFSRHNFGFIVADRIAKERGIRLWRFGFRARYCRVRFGNEEVILLKPKTYMNASGDAVLSALRYFKLSPNELIVIHDDLDLELGRLKLVFGGGSAGHKGVESIIERLGTRDFYRVRLGIGRPPLQGEGVIDYVLSSFREDEKEKLEEVVSRAVLAVEVLIEEGLFQAQLRFHSKEL